MNAAVLFICVWLAHSPNFPTTEASRQETPRGVLDVVVFYAGAPRDVDRYPLRVRQELQRFLERVRAYRPRSRPARLGSEMRMVYAAREGYEGKLVAAAAVAGGPRLAQQYVDALRPCYEWEGFHDCPEREALFAEQHLRDRPETPFRDLLRVLAAHRWLCTAEAYEYEQKPGEALRARRAYDEALKIASADSRSALMSTAASELKTSGRCYATDPFSKRREPRQPEPRRDWPHAATWNGSGPSHSPREGGKSTSSPSLVIRGGSNIPGDVVWCGALRALEIANPRISAGSIARPRHG